MLRSRWFVLLKFLFVALGIVFFPAFVFAQSLGGTYVYLVQDVASVSSTYRASTTIADAFDAQIATTWDEVEAIQQATPIAALIIDHTALDIADKQWVTSAYQQGTSIVGLNISIIDFAELVGDRCLANDDFAAESYPGDFFIVASQILLGENSGEVAQVRAADRNSCGATPAENIKGLVAGSRSRATYALETPEDFRVFTTVVTQQVEQIAETREAFNSGSLR